ncbi:MAG: hypothetical protein QM535_19920 [Limnohabitans sp.]|nr:hypothetical protein [Limnohabitans sp.]
MPQYTYRAIVVSKLPDDILELIERGNLIITSFTGNAYFPAPDPTIAVVTAHLQDLVTKNRALEAGTGSKVVVNQALTLFKRDISYWVNYVQRIADESLDNAEIIINSSGFYIKERSTPSPRVYEVKSTDKGILELTAAVNPDGSFYAWEVSTDNINWTFVRLSRLATCTVSNLTSGALYYVRCITVDKENNHNPPSNTLSVRVD